MISTWKTKSFPLDVGYTDNGTQCRNKCDTYGESYYWCWTVSGEWDNCTPLKGQIYRVYEL